MKGLASLTLALTDVVHDGKTTPITTKNWAMEAKSTKKKDAAKIGMVQGLVRRLVPSPVEEVVLPKARRSVAVQEPEWCWPPKATKSSSAPKPN